MHKRNTVAINLNHEELRFAGWQVDGRRMQFRRPNCPSSIAQRPRVSFRAANGASVTSKRRSLSELILPSLFLPVGDSLASARAFSKSFSGLQLARLGAFGAFGSRSLRKCNIEPSGQEICPTRDPGKVCVGVSELACAASFCHPSASPLARSRTLWMCRQPTSCGRPAWTCQRNMALISTCEAN